MEPGAAVAGGGIAMIARAIAACLLYPAYVAWVVLIALFYGDLRGRMTRMTRQLIDVVRTGE